MESGSAPGALTETEVASLTVLENPRTLVELEESSDPSMKEELKCSMCWKFPVFPKDSATQCQMGHICCSKCSKIMPGKGCPKLIAGNSICKKEIATDVGIKNCAKFNVALNGSTFKCSYGCGAIGTGSQLAEHLVRSCPFRFCVPCVATECSSSYRFSGAQLGEHLAKAHSQVVSHSNFDKFMLMFVRPERWAARSIFFPVNLVNRTIYGVFYAFSETFVVAADELPDEFIFFGFVLNRKEVAREYEISMEIVNRKENSPTSFVFNVFHCIRQLRTENLQTHLNLQDNMALKVDKSLLKDHFRCLLMDSPSLEVTPAPLWDGTGDYFDECLVRFCVRKKAANCAVADKLE